MSQFNVGDYAMNGNREVKIIGIRPGAKTGKNVYRIEWWDRYEGRKEEYAVEGELSPVPTHTFTDCRSEPGVTIGLIDSIMTLSHVLRSRDLDPQEVQEALKDLRSNSDVAWLMDQAKAAVRG